MVVKRKRIILTAGLMVFLFCTCSNRKTDPITEIDFDCREFIGTHKDTNAMAAEFRSTMPELLDHKTALVAVQWVCLKNGSTSAKNADYLKPGEVGENGRFHPRLNRLRIWASSLLSDLSRRNRKEQITILEHISANLAEIIIAEKKVFAEGLRQFKHQRLSLENLIIGYSLSDINASDLEIIFRL